MVNEEVRSRIFGNERKYIDEVLSSEFRTSSGATMMRRLETAFAERFGVNYAISFVNGTATMHAALEAAGIRPGDEVIVPPLTMSATTFAVLQCGAVPIFADVDGETFQINASDIERKLSPRTKAIITVALYGLSPDMDDINAIAGKHNLFVLEDNAECFLGKYKGKLVGTLGDCASFSFQSSKHLTSGEGGMIITDDADFANKVRQIQSLGYAGVSASKSKITKSDIQHPNYDRHVTMGWNYRMPELCCAVALAQVENIDPLVERRMEVASLFNEALSGSQDLLIPQKTPEHSVNSYWTWVCKLNLKAASWNEFRDRFIQLGGDGFYGAWKLTYLEPMFVNRNLLGREYSIPEEVWSTYSMGLCPVAEDLQPRLLQFRTNYWNLDDAYKQSEVLQETIKSFC